MADYLPQSSASGHGHEYNNLVVKGLIVFAVVLVAVSVVIELSLVYVMRDFKREETALEALAPPGLADKSATFPAPRLQARPPVDLIKFKEDELGRLNAYGWVDREQGIAHIPIDRAIAIVATKGLPTGDVPAGKKADTVVPTRPAAADAKQDRKP
jgi:hypothetical protein